MKVYFNENDKYSNFAADIFKMFSALATEGGEPMVVTEHPDGTTRVTVNDCHYDNHYMVIEDGVDRGIEWIRKNWGKYLPQNWRENDTGFYDWTPWEHGEYAD